MGSFFSVRLAPGVRLSASSRGLRAHVGPRMARLHVGGGGTGISTGAGPMTFYQGIGGRRSRTGGYYAGPSALSVARASKEEVAEQIQRALTAISGLHRETFPPATRATAALPAVTPYGEILRPLEREELRGTHVWQRRARREARARARTRADAQAAAELARAKQAQVEAQAEIDRTWDAFVANDRDLVLAALEKAFQDNAAPTAAVNVEDGEVGLVVVVPDGVIPEREVGVTAKGNLSVRKMTKGTRAAWYRELVAGHLLVSCSEAFAVAPGLTSASVVACRRTGSRLEPLLAATLRRADVRPEAWASTLPWETLRSICEPVCNLRGRSDELEPIDPAAEPEIAQLVDAFDPEG